MARRGIRSATTRRARPPAFALVACVVVLAVAAALSACGDRARDASVALVDGVVRLEDSHGTHQRTLISARGQTFGGAANLSWSPDGRRILYDYDDEALESIHVDGTHRRVLLELP